MEIISEWGVWQLLDSAFPAGGFAHSGGLEAAWQQGWVRSSDDLIRFTTEYLQQTARGLLPFINGVYADRDVKALDEFLDSMLSNHVANRASRAQGHALVATAERVFGGPSLEALRLQVMGGRQPGHFVVMFAVLLRQLGIDRERATRMFLFLQVRSVFSAAVRLGAVGPLEAQRLQAGLAECLETCIADARGWQAEDAAQTSPLLDLWQLSQDRLYSRLFQS